MSKLGNLAKVLAWLAVLGGCTIGPEPRFDDLPARYRQMATEIEQPDVATGNPDLLATPPPLTVRGGEAQEYWDITLEEVIQIALARSEVIRDMQGRVLNPGGTGGVPTVYDIAVQEASVGNTRFGIGPEAALSQFDANFNLSMVWDRNEPLFNNSLFGGSLLDGIIGGILGGTPQAVQFTDERATFRAEINKTAATGTKLAARNTTNYVFNDAEFNRFSSVYDTVFEVEAVQPIGKGFGIDFNRIAGPDAQPGSYRGVVIARLNTDIALTEFEAAVRDLVRDLERTYWNLYFAYRDLDGKIIARDNALKTWRLVRNRVEAGTAQEEDASAALEQYYAFQSQVLDALSGTTTSGTVVATTGGLYSVERSLRGMMGLPASDGRLLRPVDEPLKVEVVMDWQPSLQEALMRRVEIRRQKWEVKSRELELLASQNFLKMQVDLIGRYRWLGLGDDLFGRGGEEQGSAFADLVNDSRQEWTLGFQIQTPIGNRIGHTTVRNAEWQLARHRALLREVELQISHDVASAFVEIDRAYYSTRVNFNRVVASQDQLEKSQKKFDVGTIPPDTLLEAQRRVAQAQTEYYRSLVNYELAIANIYRSRGALLDYNQVYLAEGPWAPLHHRSAKKQSRAFQVKRVDYPHRVPPNVSFGPAPQLTLPQGSHDELVPADGEGEDVPPLDLD